MCSTWQQSGQVRSTPVEHVLKCRGTTPLDSDLAIGESSEPNLWQATWPAKLLDSEHRGGVIDEITDEFAAISEMGRPTEGRSCLD